MTRTRTGRAVSILAVLLLLANLALSADTKQAAEAKRPQYKKVTGEVVSAGPNSIVVKSRSKGDVSLALTSKTDIINGKTPKPGDRVRVNYRLDKSGKTATRVEILAQAAAGPAQVQAQQPAKSSK